MSETTCQYPEREAKESESFAFGAKDSRGREIGALIIKFINVWTADSSGNWRHEPGRFFVFKPHATRNGSTYGPAQHENEFLTSEERDAAIEKYLRDARKRAAKAAKAAA